MRALVTVIHPLAGLSLLALACVAGAQSLPVEAEKPFVPDGRPLEGLVITIDPASDEPTEPAEQLDSNDVVAGFSDADLNMLVAGHLFHHLRKAGAVVLLTRRDGQGRATFERIRGHVCIVIKHETTNRIDSPTVAVWVGPTGARGLSEPLSQAVKECLFDEIARCIPDAAHGVGAEMLVTGNVPTAIVSIRLAGGNAWPPLRGAHRPVAIGLYHGIARLWKEHRPELDTWRERNTPETLTTRPTATQPDAAPGVVPPDRSKLLLATKALWRSVSPPDTPADADWLIQQYCQRVLSDTTFFHLRAHVDADGDQWTIRGATNCPQLNNLGTRVLAAVGRNNVKSELELLPSARLGEKRFGVVRVPMALTWAEPENRGMAQNQLLLGEPVFLLDATSDGEYLSLHSPDSYIAWVHRDVITRLDEKALTEWSSAPAALLLTDHRAGGLRVPTGAALPTEPADTKTTVRLRLPPGTTAEGQPKSIDVPAADVRLPAETSAGVTAARKALEYLTTPYVFGGRSRIGLDCSGLTGIAYASVGLALPRDARQQILVGRLVATPWYRSTLRPGDLVFFCHETGHIFHVGVSLGGSRFVHCAPPEVQVSSFDPNDPLYDEGWTQSFCFGRRPLP